MAVVTIINNRLHAIARVDAADVAKLEEDGWEILSKTMTPDDTPGTAPHHSEIERPD